MSFGKKFKKAILDEIGPTPTFEEFCAKAGIVLDKPPQKQKKRKKLSLWLALSPVAAAAVALAIVLPVTLIPAKTTEPSGGGEHFGTVAMHSEEITYDEFVSDADISMFNARFMFDDRTDFSKMYVDDKTGGAAGHIGYSVTTEVYGAAVGGVPYVYGFTLTTARSNALSVLDKSAFYGCDKSVTYNGVKYNYKVNVGLTVGMSVYYRIGKYEYYATVEPLGTAAIADEDYMEMFLRLAFDEVEGAERVTLD